MKALVTGGASFIGSHLVEKLLDEDYEVVVIDDLSSGSEANLKMLGETKALSLLQWDLRHGSGFDLSLVMKGIDEVYHLAADHGGRGYVETQQVNCANNFAIDQNVLEAVKTAEVPKVIFASSGCIYPMSLQTDVSERHFLVEEDAGPPFEPDGIYGMAKLTCELTLNEMFKELGTQSVSCRFFTVYGPRAKENHAVIAFIARAFIHQEPFEIWGDGSQIRNWTYVDDIVDGMLLSRSLEGCQALNLGTEERISVQEAVDKVIELEGYTPEYKYLLDKPTGPLNRVASHTKYILKGGKEPLSFWKGLEKTIEWYKDTHDINDVKANLERLLIARK